MMDNNNGAEWCRHIKGLVLALDIVQGLILDLCLELDFLDGWIGIGIFLFLHKQLFHNPDPGVSLCEN